MPLIISPEDFEISKLDKLKAMEPFLMLIIKEVENRFDNYEEGFVFIEDNIKDEYIRFFMLKIYEVRNLKQQV
jgi:hypothetical protein